MMSWVATFLHAELYRNVEPPIAGNVIRENVRGLPKVLAGPRCEIVNHPNPRV
jgi:hypothetical protein